MIFRDWHTPGDSLSRSAHRYLGHSALQLTEYILTDSLRTYTLSHPRLYLFSHLLRHRKQVVLLPDQLHLLPRGSLQTTGGLVSDQVLLLQETLLID